MAISRSLSRAPWSASPGHGWSSRRSVRNCPQAFSAPSFCSKRARSISSAIGARGAFERYSFDLIYARPDQTPQAWTNELTHAISEAAEHLSLYQLTIEEGTPFFGLHAAVTRQDHENHPDGGWHADQRMSREEALRAFTLDAAYAAHQEDRQGTLEPGKLADIIVVNGNPLYDITALAHVETVVKGGKVMKRP